MPIEYMEMMLCERFGWTIEELDAQDGERVTQFLEMWAIETEYHSDPDKKNG